MSNIKRVKVTGHMPFDAGQDSPSHERLMGYLGRMNLPCFGLRIQYGLSISKYGPVNKHNGRTAFYAFVLMGEEAVRVEWVIEFVALVKAVGGTIEECRAWDLENDCQVLLDERVGLYA